MRKKLENVIKKANYWATPIYERLPLWCFPKRNQRFKAYNVGMPKTGTTSIHIIFSDKYRSGYETESRFLVYKILAFAQGKINQNEFSQYIKRKDRRLGLEMDSSTLNYFLLDILLSEFEEAKFILPMRDCYSWLDSYINHNLARPYFRQHWYRSWVVEWNNFRFKANQFEYAKEEQVLADNGLYTLDGYFSYWMEHNSQVLAKVPKERLFVVKTREINQNIPRIEDFLGITPGSLSRNARGNVGSQKFHLLSQIDKDFLEAKANFHCKPLMDKYFPEINGFRE